MAHRNCRAWPDPRSIAHQAAIMAAVHQPNRNSCRPAHGTSRFSRQIQAFSRGGAMLASATALADCGRPGLSCIEALAIQSPSHQHRCTVAGSTVFPRHSWSSSSSLSLEERHRLHRLCDFLGGLSTRSLPCLVTRVWLKCRRFA